MKEDKERKKHPHTPNKDKKKNNRKRNEKTHSNKKINKKVELFGHLDALFKTKHAVSVASLTRASGEAYSRTWRAVLSHVASRTLAIGEAAPRWGWGRLTAVLWVGESTKKLKSAK